MSEWTYQTYATDAQVTDWARVNALLAEYRFPIGMDIFLLPGTDQLRIEAPTSFVEAYTTPDENRSPGEVPHDPALSAFLDELSGFIDAADPLVIQMIGWKDASTPLIGLEWVVGGGIVSETAFTVGESSTWTGEPPV